MLYDDSGRYSTVCALLLSSNRPGESLSVSLLGLSWWCQLHTGQVRRPGNTNGSMKALSTDSDMVKRILIDHFAESQLDKHTAQKDTVAFNKKIKK